MLLSIFRVSGHSMEPTLTPGQIVLGSSLFYFFVQPAVGDLVLFRYNGKIFVKRVEKINVEKYSITGDNKNDSLDSRKIGWITKKEILGKVLYAL